MLQDVLDKFLVDVFKNAELEFEGEQVNPVVAIAGQVVKPKYPLITIDFGKAITGNTPFNRIVDYELVDAEDGYKDVTEYRGVVYEQDVIIKIIDTNLKRIKHLQNQIYFLAESLYHTMPKQSEDGRIRQIELLYVTPPINLDEFQKSRFIYCRAIYLVVEFAAVTPVRLGTVETVEYDVTPES